MAIINKGIFPSPLNSYFDPKIKNTRILYVEDYPIARRAFYLLLTKDGFLVDLAETAEETWQKYLINNYEIILLDGSLPDKTGFEVAKQIRAMEHKEKRIRSKIILLSAHSYELVENECKLADIDKFLIKPIDFYWLREVINSLLSKNH